jgi:carbon-monoxide dehydrogenase large subunit
LETALVSSTLKFGSGQAVERLEDAQLLQGLGQYTNDVNLPEQTRLCFVRSPYPHARIMSVDTSAAQAMPGVRLIVTGPQLLAAGVKPMPRAVNFKRADGSPLAAPERYILAAERARYVGEAVAAVVADTEQQARDAAEAVIVDYQDLPHAVNMHDALADNAPLITDSPDNRVAETRYGNAQAAAEAFARAAHVVQLDITNQRLVALTIEPRSVLAYPDAGRLTVRISSQMPTSVRGMVADLLGLKPEDIRVIVGDVGGGFGMKTGAYPEDVVAAYCAHQLQRPVRWIADRSEDFLTSAHGRDIESQAALALDAQGKILALRVHSKANVGAYPSMTGLAIQLLIGPWVQSSVYDIQTIDYHFTGVMTNTACTGAYRGAGRPEAIYNMERLMDEAARQSGIDRIALRRMNFVQPQQMPYTRIQGNPVLLLHRRSMKDGTNSIKDPTTLSGKRAPRQCLTLRLETRRQIPHDRRSDRGGRIRKEGVLEKGRNSQEARHRHRLVCGEVKGGHGGPQILLGLHGLLNPNRFQRMAPIRITLGPVQELANADILIDFGCCHPLSY